MNKEIVGLISGALVIVSIVPYSIRVYQRKITPNLTSWLLWILIGLVLLLTYKSSGAQDNVWPAVFGFINPCVVVVLLLLRNRQWAKFDKFEQICLVTGLLSLIIWLYTRENKDLAQYALYLAIIADALAAIPTIRFLWKNPEKDRPYAWVMFGIGYGLTILAISDLTPANLILPIYMFINSSFIAAIVLVYRVKNHISFREWI